MYAYNKKEEEESEELEEENVEKEVEKCSLLLSLNKLLHLTWVQPHSGEHRLYIKMKEVKPKRVNRRLVVGGSIGYKSRPSTLSDRTYQIPEMVSAILACSYDVDVYMRF